MAVDPIARAKFRRDRASLLTLLGELVITWNALEGRMRNLLISAMSTEEQRANPKSTNARARAQILATQLPNVPLSETVQLFGKFHVPETADHIKHLCKLFNRHRENRNFFVHATFAAGSKNGKPEGIASQVRVKGSLSTLSYALAERC